MNTIRYNCGVCTNKAEVQTAVWNFCNQTNNKQTHLIIVNSAKDDIFTSFMNYSIVDVILTESSSVWSNHPSFFMYDANGDACTGQLSVTSATMAVSGEPWKKFVKGQQTGTVSYTPSITASSTGFAVNNISFMYYVEGKRLHVSGRFNVTSGGSGSSGISISLPSGMTALNMGAGKCGEVTLNRNVAHMYSVRCDGGTSVWIQTGAGSADITSVYGSGYIQVSFDVLLT